MLNGKNLRLSPLLIAILTFSSLVGFNRSVQAEIVNQGEKPPEMTIEDQQKPNQDLQSDPSETELITENQPQDQSSSKIEENLSNSNQEGENQTITQSDSDSPEEQPSAAENSSENPVNNESDSNPTEEQPNAAENSSENPVNNESDSNPTEETKPDAAPESNPTPETQPSNNQLPQFNPTTETETSSEPRVLVGEVVVTGTDDPELLDLVYQTLKTKPGRPTTRSGLQEDVNAIYATGFFGNVTVIPKDTPLGVQVTFAVEPNPTLKQVVIQTVPEGTEQQVLPQEIVDEAFTDQYGQIINLRDFQEGIKKIEKWYNDNGYDLAQVVDTPKVDGDGVVTLIIAEGVIENIQVRFFNQEDEPVDGKTRDFIVTREVELKPGDVFNRNTAQQDLQRVFGLGLFEDARFSFSPGEDPTQVVVNVDVVEGKSGSIAAGAGVSSSSGFFGSLSYQQKNLGGNNQTLGAEIQLGTREFLFDVNFTDPWIGGDPYRTSYSISAFRRRTISMIFDGGDPDVDLPNGDTPRINRTGGGIVFSRPLPANPYAKPEWRLSAGFDYQHVAITDSDGDISPRDEYGNLLSWDDSGKDDLFMFKFGASRDTRNDGLEPTQGYVLRLGMDQTVPLGSGSILFNRLRASYSHYIPVKLLNFTEGPQALAFNIQAGTVLGDLPPYEAFSMGGSNSVRGYEEGDLGSGKSYIQATAEYRFPLFSFIRGALFFDYGTDLDTASEVPGDPAGIRNKPGSGFGYGVGVRIKSPLGPIRVDYAINDDGDTRFHFGIGEKF